MRGHQRRISQERRTAVREGRVAATHVQDAAVARNAEAVNAHHEVESMRDHQRRISQERRAAVRERRVAATREGVMMSRATSPLQAHNRLACFIVMHNI